MTTNDDTREGTLRLVRMFRVDAAAEALHQRRSPLHRMVWRDNADKPCSYCWNDADAALTAAVEVTERYRRGRR